MVVCVRIWSVMIEYVILYGRICSNMVKYERVCDLLWSYVGVWSNMIEYVILYGRICSNMTVYGQIRTFIIVYGQILTFMVSYDPVCGRIWFYMVDGRIE